MEWLPQDLIFNILSRHFVKCLLRFRCVSKLFCSLIDSQEFAKIHLKRSIETDSNLSLVLSGTVPPSTGPSRYWLSKIFSASLDSLDIAVELDHPFKNCKRETPIIDSCNGLIALEDSGDNIALWNPSTKKHLIIPKFWSDVKDSFCFVNGFGYDAASDDYKIVRIIFVRETDEYIHVAVYSLKTNSSRQIRVNFPYYFLHYWDGTFVGNHVHWLVAKTSESYIEDVIVAFDLKREEFHEVPLPSLENRNSVNVMFLGTFRGCLYFSCLFNYPEPVDIWVMKESWTKLFSFSRDVFHCDYVKALAYSKSGENVLVDKFEYHEDEDPDGDQWKLYWYDLQNPRAACHVMIHGVPQGCRHTIICVDSLVSLAAYTGRGV